LRYFFHIGFKGTHYLGWQRLPDVPSVQATIEMVLGKVLHCPVSIVGCGRTDAQVHASQFFFHVDIEEQWDYDLVFRLNRSLPADISVYDIVAVGAKNHVRFDAIQRQYDYFFHTYKDPFLHQNSSAFYGGPLLVDEMRRAVACLPKYHDYRSFCKSPDKNEHTICRVSAAALYANDKGDRFRFHISSNRFLGGMIRAIMARLLQVGKGELTVAQFEALLSHPQTPVNIKLAAPAGLFLSKVTYPFLDLPSRTNIIANEWHELTV
jgi:tRNA pseudouridine38-40 synthase